MRLLSKALWSWLSGGLGLLVVVIVLTACVPQRGAHLPANTTDGSAPAGSYVPILAASTLEVGSNRLPLGIVQDGTPINDPNLMLHLRFYYLSGDNPTQIQHETDAVYSGQGLPFGLYVAHATFDQAGTWGVEVEIPLADSAPQINQIRLNVLEASGIPAVGSAAIPSTNLTSADVPALDQLTSDSQPDPDIYQMTIADALNARQPFLVIFATPGFCQTAVCVPNMHVVKQLKQAFQDQINFLHIEVYPYPFGESFQQQRLVPAMAEWNLRTEPWTFLVDSAGVIQARYEGGITLTELEPALQQLAAGDPITAIPVDE